MPKDKVGNTLHEGDWVEVTMPTPQLVGRVVKIKEGGTLIPAGKDANLLQAGSVLVAIEVSDNYDPRIGIATSVVKIHHPLEGQKETVN